MSPKKKIVVIGGGTGSFVVLRGLKKYPFDITAVVTMFDSGGSSGVLRDEFGILPPGDARRCLIALSEGEKEATLRNLFNFRFDNEESSLHGHNFGNLLITALTHIKTNEAEAIKEAGELLNIQGRVLPVSLNTAHLCAELEDGSIIEGETNIDIPAHNGELKIKRAFLKPEAYVFEETAKAILEAEYILISPGDLYTSIIPNFLVSGVSEAIKESGARTVYILNLMTKWGETHGFKASDFARTALSYARLSFFDYIICNTKSFPEKLKRAYITEKKHPVTIDEDLKKYTKRLIAEDVYDDAFILRHDSDKLGAIIAGL
jgi:uncharacterized cofD-like protein